MGLTKRKDSYYIEFSVLDDGKTLHLGTECIWGKTEAVEGGQLNRTLATAGSPDQN
jgi:hypothetical protein